MFSMFIVKLFLNKNIWRVIYMEPQNKFNVKETATYGNECLLQQSLILFIYDSIALLSCWVYLSSFSRTLLIRKSNSLKRKTKTQRKKNNNKQKNKQTKQNERKGKKTPEKWNFKTKRKAGSYVRVLELC